jgi:hypothetical protein
MLIIVTDKGWTGRYCTIPYDCSCSLIHYVLVFLLIIDLYVSVIQINLALDVS